VFTEFAQIVKIKKYKLFLFYLERLIILKYVKKACFFVAGLSLDDLKREATICHMLKHPHIVELLETYR
jgi:hypothetical protein